MAPKPRGGNNPSGYVSPTRAGKRKVSACLDPRLFAALHEITALQNKTMQDTLEQLCRDFVRRERNKSPHDPSLG
jgi:hypothetical protein